jgi:hypothetical protein
MQWRLQCPSLNINRRGGINTIIKKTGEEERCVNSALSWQEVEGRVKIMVEENIRHFGLTGIISGAWTGQTVHVQKKGH